MLSSFWKLPAAKTYRMLSTAMTYPDLGCSELVNIALTFDAGVRFTRLT